MAPTAVQVRLSQEDKSITVGRLGESIAKLAQALRGIDRAYETQFGKLPAIQWVVKDLFTVGRDILIQIGPIEGSRPRASETLSEPVRFFMSGLERLETSAALPEYYSENTVRRILDLGAKKGNAVQTAIASVNGQVGKEVVLNESLLDNAQRAISGNYRTIGSVVGKLDILDSRHGDKNRFRSNLLDESSNRGVVAVIAKDREGELRQLWNKRVLLFGEITKNDTGQPIRIDVSEVVEIPPEGGGGREFVDLVGVAPDWTEGLDSVEYLRRQRGA